MEEEYQERIIRKYRRLAQLPDFLFGFTFPLRRMAVERLSLLPGSKVLEVGCSSGANFSLLYEAVGAKGEIVGVDLSPDMVARAQLRIKRNGWQNIKVIQQAAEEVVLTDQYDGLLLFAMHDIITSPQALENILVYLNPSGRVVAAGPKLSSSYPGKTLNPMIRLVFNRFAISKQNMDYPWRLLAGRIKDIQVEEYALGITYLVYGMGRKSEIIKS